MEELSGQPSSNPPGIWPRLCCLECTPCLAKLLLLINIVIYVLFYSSIIYYCTTVESITVDAAAAKGQPAPAISSYVVIGTLTFCLVFMLIFPIMGLLGVCTGNSCKIVLGAIGAILGAIQFFGGIFSTLLPLYANIICGLLLVFFVYETIFLFKFRGAVRRGFAGCEDSEESIVEKV